MFYDYIYKKLQLIYPYTNNILCIEISSVKGAFELCVGTKSPYVVKRFKYYYVFYLFNENNLSHDDVRV